MMWGSHQDTQDRGLLNGIAAVPVPVFSAYSHAMAVLALRCADLNGEWEMACRQVREKLAA